MERPIVLLADDNPSVREALCDLFHRHGGFRIGGVASDGLEAALLADEIQPQAVLLDEYLPRWDGWQAAEFIRSHCPHTKIIALAPAAPGWGDLWLDKTHMEDLILVVSTALAA